MEISQQRIKTGGYKCDLDTRSLSLSETINLIVDTELNWGGKSLDRNNDILIETIVFGDKDITIVFGTKVELDVIREVIKSHKENRTQGVIQYLFNIMGFMYDNSYIYSFDDTCVVYGAWLAGDKNPELIELIVKKTLVQKEPLTHDKIDELIDLKKKLDLKSDDGALRVLTQSLLSY